MSTIGPVPRSGGDSERVGFSQNPPFMTSKVKQDTMSRAESGSSQPVAGTGPLSYVYAGISWFFRGLSNIVDRVIYFLSLLGIGSSQSEVAVPFAERADQIKEESKRVDTPYKQMGLLFRVAHQWKDDEDSRRSLFIELMQGFHSPGSSDHTRLEEALAQELKEKVLVDEDIEDIFKGLGGHLFNNAIDSREGTGAIKVLQELYHRQARFQVEVDAAHYLSRKEPSDQIHGLRILRAVVRHSLDDEEVDAAWLNVHFRQAFEKLKPEAMNQLRFAYIDEVMGWEKWEALTKGQLIEARNDAATRALFADVESFADLTSQETIEEGDFRQLLDDVQGSKLKEIYRIFYGANQRPQQLVREEMDAWIQGTDRADEQVFYLIEKAFFTLGEQGRAILNDIIKKSAQSADLSTPLYALIRYSDFRSGFLLELKAQVIAERLAQAEESSIRQAVEEKADEITEAVEARREEEGFDEDTVREQETKRVRDEVIAETKLQIETQFDSEWALQAGSPDQQSKELVEKLKAMTAEHPGYLTIAAQACLKK